MKVSIPFNLDEQACESDSLPVHPGTRHRNTRFGTPDLLLQVHIVHHGQQLSCLDNLATMTQNLTQASTDLGHDFHDRLGLQLTQHLED